MNVYFSNTVSAHSIQNATSASGQTSVGSSGKVATGLSATVTDSVELRSSAAPGKTENQQNQLTEEERKQLEQLKKIDAEVRAHENAHMSAAGDLAISGASFGYQQGPDARKYAVEGEVQIDSSSVPDDPEATIDKMEQVRKAALAPSDPSSQDFKVAAEATTKANAAQMELVRSGREASDTDKTEEADQIQKNSQREFATSAYLNNQFSTSTSSASFQIHI